jgi:hypothetical protein
MLVSFGLMPTYFFLYDAELWRSPAAESGSAADAGGSQVQCFDIY